VNNAHIKQFNEKKNSDLPAYSKFSAKIQSDPRALFKGRSDVNETKEHMGISRPRS